MTNVTAASTPATVLADLLTAVAAHLRAHPHLPFVDLSRSGGSVSLQMAAYKDEGWTDQTAILAWAASLPGSTITLSRYTHSGSKTDVVVEVAGGELRPWTALDVAADFDLQRGEAREVTYADLYEAIAPADPGDLVGPCRVCAGPARPGSDLCESDFYDVSDSGR